MVYPASFSSAKVFVIRLLLIVSFLGNGLYLWWRFHPLLWTNPALSLILLFAELVFFLSLIIHLPILWFRRIVTEPPLRPISPVKVAILIPTYNESLEILSVTIQQALAVNVPCLVQLKVVVLDDGHRPWLKTYLAEQQKTGRVSLEYLTRAERTGFKAGNINHYLNHFCHEDWLLVLDADFVPQADILDKFYPYLGDSRLGFIQAPQVFDNISPADLYGQDPDLWFSVLEVGRAGQDALICCGTPTVMSVPALRSIQGMQIGVTEDFITGVALQSHGFRAQYLRVDVAEGKASTDIIDVINKAERYAAGAFEFFLKRRKWSLGNQLGFRQKFLHFTYPLSFIAPLFTPILIILPIISLVTGISPFAVDNSSYFFLLAQFTSLLSLQLLFFLLIGRKSWRAWQFYWGLFPASFAALFRSLFGKSRFVVSAKGNAPAISGVTQLRSVIWQVIFFLLSLIALGQAAVLLSRGELSLSLYPSVGWLLLNTALLSGVLHPPLLKIKQELFEMLY